MFTSHKQISPPSLVLKLKISEVSQKWIPKAVELKRIPTHKKCKCKKFCSQTRLVGEIYSSDVIMHRGYYKSPHLHKTAKAQGIPIFVVKQRHRANSLFQLPISDPRGWINSSSVIWFPKKRSNSRLIRCNYKTSRSISGVEKKQNLKGIFDGPKAACKRTQQLPTVLGPVVHRGKDTTHESL